MAIASTRTILPLDRFAKIVGINPLHFNGVHLEATDLAIPACLDPYGQFAYQLSDRVGREEIAQTIADAENLITEYLGFAPGPLYTQDEHFDLNWRLGLSQGVKLAHGYFIAAGVETKTLIEASVPVVYEDLDDDDYYEHVELTISVPAGTPPSELGVYYPGMAGEDAYEIRNVNVTVTGTLAVIKLRREQLVVADEFMGLVVIPVNGTDDEKFLEEVDVYRRYLDNSAQVAYQFMPVCCEYTPCQPGGHVLARDHRLSQVYSAPGTWNAVTGTWECTNWCACGYPRGMNISYLSGLATLSDMWARAITYYALALLDRPLCSCSGLTAYVAHWADDLASQEDTGTTSKSYNLAQGLLSNPLGTTRAGIYVWRLIQRYRLGESV